MEHFHQRSPGIVLIGCSPRWGGLDQRLWPIWQRPTSATFLTITLNRLRLLLPVLWHRCSEIAGRGICCKIDVFAMMMEYCTNDQYSDRAGLSVSTKINGGRAKWLGQGFCLITSMLAIGLIIIFINLPRVGISLLGDRGTIIASGSLYT